MTTKPWIQVGSSLNMRVEPRQKLEFTLFVPPHEVPQAVRGDFDKQLNRLVIEIRYLDDEDFKRTALNEVVCLRIGKKSQRLLGMELDTAKLNVAKVQFQVQALENEIQKALAKFLEEKRGSEERENYSLAAKAIESKRGQLISPSPLVPAH